MNLIKSFRNYIIGDALAQTDDVFKKARIELTYNFTLFFIILGLFFYGNLIANNYTWQIYITTFAVITLPLVLVVLKKTQNIRYAAYVYIGNQLFMHIANSVMLNFEMTTEGAFWMMVLLTFTFFVLGARWGWSIVCFDIVFIVFGLINKSSGYAFFHLDIPKEQIVAEEPIFLIVPFLITSYGLYIAVNTRKAAEKVIKEQKIILAKNNKELEAKNEDITASINYARRIQQAVLPHEDSIYRSIPLSFILYKPRDIVSGDFFWFHEIDRDNYILVIADCTGHGVPGALMTVIGSNLLNQIVTENKISRPSEILVELDNRITATLKQEKEHHQIIQDGMDLALIKVNKQKKEFVFTSAKRPAIFIRNKQLQEFKGSKFSLGGLRSEEKKFEEIAIKYEENDIIYMFTDGYIDQFGGSDNKKFMIKSLRELLLHIHHLPMPEQKQKINDTIEKWIGSNEQTDDILVIGIRF